MATVREIKGRIVSVQNIQKITETMEKISSAKISRMTVRFRRAREYYEGLKEIFFELLASGSLEEDFMGSSLLGKRRNGDRILILAMSSSRGLCGSYNSNILTQTKKLYHQYEEKSEQEKSEQEKRVRLVLMGKKIVDHFRYIKIPFEKGIPELDERVSYEKVGRIFGEVEKIYLEGKVDRVEWVYTHYESPSRQKVRVKTLLPISLQVSLQEGSKGSKGDTVPGRDRVQGVSKESSKESFREESLGLRNYIFEPDKKSLWERLPFLFLRAELYQDILGGFLSENIARRIAMKQASDSAGEMIQELKKEYNHARQNKITKELIEIMGAVKALAK